MRSNRFLLALFVPLLLTACEEDPVQIDEGQIDRYVLTSIDGQALPQEFEDDEGTFAIVGGRIMMHENGAFTDEIDYEFEVAGETKEQTQTAAGIYATAGDAILFTYTGSQVPDLEGTLEGETLTLVTDEITFVYQQDLEGTAGTP